MRRGHRKKRSISLPTEQAGMTYSAWLAQTARTEFTLRAGLAAVAGHELEHGVLTTAEFGAGGRSAATVTKYRHVPKPVLQLIGRAPLRELTAHEC